ncbi:MAG: hypothetical protein NUV94_04195 [Candidatus Acetothermia bacterium]|nr:hypothetical protein [Candidatus Acetothermia bacterium]
MRVARLAAGRHVDLGLLERDGCAIYDAFVLSSDRGVRHVRDPGG